MLRAARFFPPWAGASTRTARVCRFSCARARSMSLPSRSLPRNPWARAVPCVRLDATCDVSIDASPLRELAFVRIYIWTVLRSQRILIPTAWNHACSNMSSSHVQSLVFEDESEHVVCNVYIPFDIYFKGNCTLLTVPKTASLPSVSLEQFVERLTLGKRRRYRECNFAECGARQIVCRVSDKKHSAKP